MVIDLTNSSRYYTFDETCGTSEFEYPGTDAQSVFYRKVPSIACSSTLASYAVLVVWLAIAFNMCHWYLRSFPFIWLPLVASPTPMGYCRSAAKGVVKRHSQMQ